MKGNTLPIIIIVALVLLGGWYYYSAVRTPHSPTPSLVATSSPVTQTVPPGEGMETGTLPASSEKEFTVSAYNFGFTPSTLSVKKGDHVKITLANTGGMHDFKIDEFNVVTPRIGTGASTTVEFDATKAGVFQYYCSVGNHRAMGMWGTLTVTP